MSQSESHPGLHPVYVFCLLSNFHQRRAIFQNFYESKSHYQRLKEIRFPQTRQYPVPHHPDNSDSHPPSICTHLPRRVLISSHQGSKYLVDGGDKKAMHSVLYSVTTGLRRGYQSCSISLIYAQRALDNIQFRAEHHPPSQVQSY